MGANKWQVFLGLVFVSRFATSCELLINITMHLGHSDGEAPHHTRLEWEPGSVPGRPQLFLLVFQQSDDRSFHQNFPRALHSAMKQIHCIQAWLFSPDVSCTIYSSNETVFLHLNLILKDTNKWGTSGTVSLPLFSKIGEPFILKGSPGVG